MGLMDVLEDGPVRRLLREDSDEVSITDLEDEFGEEAVKRGIAYMESLSEADQSYRESANGERYSRKYSEAFADGEADEETMEKASERWEKSQKKNGLGLRDR